MRVYKIFLDWSDRIDIWIQDKYNKQPKKKLLEMQQDLFPNERVTNAITEALHNEPTTRQRKIPKKREKKEKEA
jgi:hypothetical protein